MITPSIYYQKLPIILQEYDEQVTKLDESISYRGATESPSFLKEVDKLRKIVQELCFVWEHLSTNEKRCIDFNGVPAVDFFNDIMQNDVRNIFEALNQPTINYVFK